MVGKGDKRRPRSVSKAQFRMNWDRIFAPDEAGSHCYKCGDEACRGVEIGEDGMCDSCRERSE